MATTQAPATPQSGQPAAVPPGLLQFQSTIGQLVAKRGLGRFSSRELARVAGVSRTMASAWTRLTPCRFAVRHHGLIEVSYEHRGPQSRYLIAAVEETPARA